MPRGFIKAVGGRATWPRAMNSAKGHAVREECDVQHDRRAVVEKRLPFYQSPYSFLRPELFEEGNHRDRVGGGGDRADEPAHLARVGARAVGWGGQH